MSDGKAMTGTFCDLTKYGSDGWGISIECDGDVYPGLEVMVRRKDGEVKPITVDDVIYEDPWKVVCTARRDPNDKPAGARKGATRRGGDLGGEGGDDDPRPRRQGTVAFGTETIDLGGTRIAKGVSDFDALLDIG
jgi:hypothetical protein